TLWVRGTPPMHTNSEFIGRRTRDGSSAEETTTARRCASASSSTNCVPVRMSTLSSCETCVTRYWDIESANLRPRTSNVTWEAWREKRTAACPAEFPPPTIAPRHPLHDTLH